MFITKINVANSMKAIAIISIASIDVREKSMQITYTEQNKVNIFKNAINSKNNKWQSNLWTAWEILNLRSNQKQKIISILSDCSSNCHKYKKNKESSGYKYLQRFNYKYNKYHDGSFKFKDRHKIKVISQYYSIGIAILYSIYKILQANSKFSACRKFKTAHKL